ncbi:MAG TPA: antibiotic biosynthesis monooxygenase [Methylobacter sp.]|jgi:quinol monooxygenase YgiN
MKANNKITIANHILITAKVGQEDNLATFLKGGADAVVATEPYTLSWFAARISQNTFLILDFFADQAGMDAHLAGQVAAALKAKADELIEGGWDNGVLKHFQVLEVLSAAI